jgi:hypothetical protein
MAIAGRFPGGRPLRRRRQMGLALANRRLRGTAALHASTDHRWQLIVLELELVLELGAIIRPSTWTLTHRKPNNIPFVVTATAPLRFRRPSRGLLAHSNQRIIPYLLSLLSRQQP